MENSYSLLSKSATVQVHLEPFPHLIIDDALPEDIYQILSKEFPNPEDLPESLQAKNNHRYNLLSEWGATEFEYANASKAWKEFLEYHSSEAFVKEVCALFPQFMTTKDDQLHIDIDTLGPDLSGKLNLPQEIPVTDIVARSTVAINTPVKAVSSVRGPHTDNLRKAYVGLFYMRAEEDDSTGSNLEVHKWKAGSKREEWPVAVDLDLVEKVRTIEYKPNRFLLFMTTSDALHAVSPRSITPHFRRLIVTSGWLPGVQALDTDTMHGGLRAIKNAVLLKLRSIFR